MHLSQLTREQSFGNIFTFMPININCVAMDNCINTKIIRNIPECKSVKNSFEPKPKQAHARSKWCRRNVNNSRSRFKPKGETPINFLLQWKFYLFFRNLSTKIWMEYFFLPFVWQVSRNLFTVSYIYDLCNKKFVCNFCLIAYEYAWNDA